MLLIISNSFTTYGFCHPCLLTKIVRKSFIKVINYRVSTLLKLSNFAGNLRINIYTMAPLLTILQTNHKSSIPNANKNENIHKSEAQEIS